MQLTHVPYMNKCDLESENGWMDAKRMQTFTTSDETDSTFI